MHTSPTVLDRILTPFYTIKNYIKRESLRREWKRQMKSFYKSEQYKKILAEKI